jgi:hypothetical protein
MDDSPKDKSKLMQDMEQVEKEFDFERAFYIAVTGTEIFDVIPIPDDSGYIPTAKELKLIQLEYNRQKMKVIFRISHGKHATVYDPDTGKIGIMPEGNSKGFFC